MYQLSAIFDAIYAEFTVELHGWIGESGEGEWLSYSVIGLPSQGVKWVPCRALPYLYANKTLL